MPPHGIEVVWVSAAEVGAAVLIFFVLVGLAFAAGAWAMRGSVEPDQVPVESVDDPEQTVEIRTAEVKRGRRRPPKTGTVHVPGVRPVPADDPTVVIRLPGGQS